MRKVLLISLFFLLMITLCATVVLATESENVLGDVSLENQDFQVNAKSVMTFDELGEVGAGKSFQNIINTAVIVYAVIYILVIIYLIAEIVVIIKKGDNSGLFFTIINIMVVLIGLIPYIIPSIPSIIKLISKNKKLKIYMNIVTILYLIAIIMILLIGIIPYTPPVVTPA